MKANPVFSLYIPTKLVFGCGEIKKLSSEKLPGKKALVVISAGTAMRKYGYLERVLAQLRLNNVETQVYDKILPLSLIHIFCISTRNTGNVYYTGMY